MGLIALRSVIDEPGLELTRLIVHSDAKAGRDAGALCGIDHVGVVATQDAYAALGNDVDVVVYTCSGNTRIQEALDDMALALRAGKDVVSVAFAPLVYADGLPEDLIAPLRQACVEGNSSLFTTGIDPGFASSLIPLMLTGTARTITQIRISEILNYGTYPGTEALMLFGLGEAPYYPAFALAPGLLSFIWGPTLHEIADGIGVTIDRFEENLERTVTEEEFATSTITVPAGHVAGVRFSVIGYVDDQPMLQLHHVTRLRDDARPDWPQFQVDLPPKDFGHRGVSSQGGYRIEIDGTPMIRCNLEMAHGTGQGPTHDHEFGLRLAGITYMVNAIPAVHAAPPGILSSIDLPLITGKGHARADYGPIPDTRTVDAH
jgi:4-hydroxy-tetrahydrodipicolinate reductase